MSPSPSSSPSHINPTILKSTHRRVYGDLVEYIEENFHPQEGVDEYMATLTPDEALNYFLEWNGIMNYTHTILSAIDGLNFSAAQKKSDLLSEENLDQFLSQF